MSEIDNLPVLVGKRHKALAGRVLGRGVTISIQESDDGDGYRLRVWRHSEPVVDEIHESPSDVVKRLGLLLVGGTLGTWARAFAAAAARDLTGNG